MDLRNLDIESLIENCDSFSELRDVGRAFSKRVANLELLIKNKRIALTNIEEPKVEEKNRQERINTLKSINNLMVKGRRGR